MIRESLAYLKKSSDVRRCYVFAVVLNEKVNVTSNKRGFRTNNHFLGTYEQVKKGLSYFYSKRIIETDGIHTQPPNL